MSEDNYSLSGRVYKSIRNNILEGFYQPGDELKEKNIGEELGVSRTPVREALRQLELEGLVSIVPNKGAVVVGVSLEDIQDIYEIRALLEGLCARWAANNISDEQITEMDENLLLSEFHESRGNYEQLVTLDSQFHEIMYDASGSRELKRVLKDYHEYVLRVRKNSLGAANRAKNSTVEHKKIAEAIKAHDAALAEECARKHIKSTKENMDKMGWENLMKIKGECDGEN